MFLAPESALVDVETGSKQLLLTELGARAAKCLSLNANLVSQELLKREELGSTGMGGGVAIPHARIPGLATPFGILARLRKPIGFDAVDGHPVDLVFLLLLPAISSGDPLKVLATVARKLRDARALGALRRAEDGAGLYKVMAEET
jgi:PTS system nitrogen regulatory IIA component